MEKNNQATQPTIQQIRKRNFLLVMPALILPFVSFLLWSLGVVGQQKKQQVSAVKKERGFRLELPGAAPAKDSTWNKLKFYEQADKDSAAIRKLQRSDPYFRERTEQLKDDAPTIYFESNKKNVGEGFEAASGSLPPHKDANEEKVYRRLSLLNEQLKVQQEKETSSLPPVIKPAPSLSVDSREIDRLENMMQVMKADNEGEDKEMQQINGVLEKILDIQYPERVNDRMKAESQSNKTQVFVAYATADHVPVTRLGSSLEQNRQDTLPLSGNGFISVGNRTSREDQGNTIAAIIPRSQVIVSGAAVQLQLTADVLIAGVRIPKHHFIYGTAVLNGERLQVHISSVRYGNHILSVNLSVYDLDGLEGIYIPGSISRDVAKQSSDQAFQSMNLSAFDPSLGAQAAGAGLQAAKTLISKKAKLVRVTVKDGYCVFLKNKSIEN